VSNGKGRGFPVEIVYFEEIEVGRERTKSPTYEVEKEEIVEFARRWDPRPFHVDEVAAASSVFGGLVACSAHIFSILSWFTSRAEGRMASLAALGFDEVRIHHPVRPRDRLSCTITCVEKRDSVTHDDRGIVRSVASLANQYGELVFSTVVTTLVAKRPR
jgi:acyl dehydratase